MMNKCPGQDDRNLKIEKICCLECGRETEIFSDEIKVMCPKCKAIICRSRLPSCIDWCKAARQCLGEKKWKELKGEV
jgi:ribosomal protein S27E